MALRVIEDLALGLVTRKRVPLLHEPNVAPLSSLDGTIISSSRLSRIVSKVLGQ